MSAPGGQRVTGGSDNTAVVQVFPKVPPRLPVPGVDWNCDDLFYAQILEDVWPDGTCVGWY